MEFAGTGGIVSAILSEYLFHIVIVSRNYLLYIKNPRYVHSFNRLKYILLFWNYRENTIRILIKKIDIFHSFSRERFVYEYESTGDMLVDLGSDQTSCHNPFLGGYYPVQVGIFMPPPPFEKGGAYCFAHVGRSVCRYPLTL